LPGEHASLNLFLFTGVGANTAAVEENLSALAVKNGEKPSLPTTYRIEELAKDDSS
jgi:hypothetical protein